MANVVSLSILGSWTPPVCSKGPIDEQQLGSGIFLDRDASNDVESAPGPDLFPKGYQFIAKGGKTEVLLINFL